MKFNPLGRSGLSVSAITLGTMTYGEQNTEREGHEQMDRAVAAGINLFDTSELYSIPPKPETCGSTERVIGTWLKARRNRDQVLIATKAIGRSSMTWFRKDGTPGRITRSQLTEALHGSLDRLQTDYVDLYQLHWPDRATPFGANPTRFDAADFDGDGIAFAEVLDVLGGFVAEGKVRHIGVSNESAWGLMSALAASDSQARPRVQSIQNAYNLLNRTADTALAEICLREQVAYLAYSPLGQGYLTGKYQRGAKPPGARNTLFNRGQRYEKPGAETAIDRYLSVAAEAGLDAAQMAIAFVMRQPFVASTLIGATTTAQFTTALAAADLELPLDVVAALDHVHQLTGNPAP